MDFMSLLGSMVQGTMSSRPAASSSRMSNAAGGVGDLLGSLMGMGQSVTQRVGGDNLAAGGLGALLGTMLGGSNSTTTNALGGGMMGLLGMMAYKALKNSGAASSSSQPLQSYTQPSPAQQESDAEIILTAMIDAAKADGQVDADEINKIMSHLQSSGAGQEGVNYIIKKLQSPMETEKLVAAARNRPELAVQIYSASLMAIEVDTDAERKYLNKLAKAMGLSDSVVKNIEQLTSADSKNYVC